jgi:type I restriction enzyme, S subunit
MSVAWPQVALGSLCSMVKGTSPTLKTLPGPYPLVVTAEFRRSADSWQIEGPAVCIPLVSSTGHGDAALHRVHYQEGKFALANLLVALIPKDAAICDANYLYHLLMAKKDSLLVPLMQGTANVSLKEKDIATVEIPLPPLAEQQRIVVRIEELSAKIHEARGLRRQVVEEAEALIVSYAHRYDLDSCGKLAQGWICTTLRDVVTLVQDLHKVQTDTAYPNLGIFSYARGLFKKPHIAGLQTSATYLNRVHAGQFIYSRLFAFEGAYGMVNDEFDNYFVSNEYPTFNCNTEKVLPEFLYAYFKSPTVWKDVAVGSKGLGDRRQRVQPQQILTHRFMLPPIEYQNGLRQLMAKVGTLKRLHSETAAELDAMLPSILDKAFKAEL